MQFFVQIRNKLGGKESLVDGSIVRLPFLLASSVRGRSHGDEARRNVGCTRWGLRHARNEAVGSGGVQRQVHKGATCPLWWRTLDRWERRSTTASTWGLWWIAPDSKIEICGT